MGLDIAGEQGRGWEGQACVCKRQVCIVLKTLQRSCRLLAASPLTAVDDYNGLLNISSCVLLPPVQVGSCACRA